jgi:hypothetical protein
MPTIQLELTLTSRFRVGEIETQEPILSHNKISFRAM